MHNFIRTSTYTRTPHLHTHSTHKTVTTQVQIWWSPLFPPAKFPDFHRIFFFFFFFDITKIATYHLSEIPGSFKYFVWFCPIIASASGNHGHLTSNNANLRANHWGRLPSPKVGPCIGNPGSATAHQRSPHTPYDYFCLWTSRSRIYILFLKIKQSHIRWRKI